MLRAAIALADEEGIEALSMRRLAKELGVEAMSLYNHVANKDEILSGMLDLVLGEIDLPAATADWKAAIRANAVSNRETFLGHPWAAALSISPQSGGGPAQLRRSDRLLRTLREAGLSEELIYHAFHIVGSHILGFTVQQLNYQQMEGADLKDLANAFLQKLPVDEYPDFVEHVQQHLEPHDGAEGGFELGLDLILDGLERLRDAAA